MYLRSIFLLLAVSLAGIVQADKFAKYFESIALYYAYKFDAQAFGSARVMAPMLSSTGGRQVATFGEFMSSVYVPYSPWKFPTPADPAEQKSPGLGSSTDPMSDPSNLRTMLDQWQFRDTYRKKRLFTQEKLKEIKNHGKTLQFAVQRIDAVRDLDLKSTGDTPRILQGQMTKIRLLFKYIQWARQEAIMRHNGLENAFKSRFDSDTLVKKLEEIPETGLKFEAPDWDATAAKNGNGDPDVVAAKAEKYRDWHKNLSPTQGTDAEKEYILHVNLISEISHMSNKLGSIQACRVFDDQHLG
ncbi:hypothetical protein CNMCM6936_002222 [Aspergillus lentulus]|uniref:Uncharacterized protein n=1 Tax=Aspergillus lentulus TaxID=293939 RepID=A0AAN5YVC3_ASPLE|nr:hypothetical protein CNMCM6069_001305 [Aspergillus lentulus]KAF4168512.1 hypothetical protein CNMCM6936_002222 [Aspergillus lentulus]KAF4178553.1 hypothetical protein CNMCM8060_004275 [Aspergillus lentulus]KAF4196929.1 hypothetical protein CNMCM8694_004189 [Aspergillus lentulus]KAF4207507.1 hypothetical protein CNMCM8927_002912 [Aspergillus lentulus]